MHYSIKRTDEQIDDVKNRIMEQMDKGGSKFHGMTYEEGLDAAIRWLFGETEDDPMED